jgi:hypothetical protein
MAVNRKVPNLGPRLSIVDAKGKRIARLGGENGPGLEAGKFLAPHGIAMDSKGDIYIGEVGVTDWKTSFPDTPMPPGASSEPLPAEAREDLGRRQQELDNARTRNARQHRRRAQRWGDQPRSELRDGGPRGRRIKQGPGASLSVGYGRGRRHFRRGGAARAAERPAGRASALCSPQGPRRSVPVLPRFSHIQICAAAARGCRRQRQRQQPPLGAFWLGLTTQISNPKAAIIYASVFAAFLPASFSLGLLQHCLQRCFSSRPPGMY